jgi:two-component system NtrC family sensor kinase
MMVKGVKKRLSLQRRIVLLVSCTTMIMMSLIVFFDTFSLEESVKKAYVSQISGMTIAINGRYEESRNVNDVQQIFDYIQYKNKSVLQLTLYSKDGKVLASTNRSILMEKLASSDYTIPSEQATLVERLPKDGQGIPKVRVIAPLLEDGNLIGAVEVLLDSSEETVLVKQRVTLIILVSAIVVLVLLVALWLILRKVVILPLMTLREAAVAVRHGGAHKKLKFSASPEMEEVSSAFNDMVVNLEERYSQLQQALDTLKNTQAQLVQSEKMGALGNLVAGVSHEINTPIGVGVTAVTYLEQKVKDFEAIYQSNKMKKSDLDQFLLTIRETADMVQSNLHRASELVRSFKQVSVDQSSEVKRSFALKAYMEDVIVSLRPTLKKTHLHTIVHCNSQLELYSYPGALSQIMTNFVMNSITHAYEPADEGNLVFQVVRREDKLILTYSDDGKGMPQEVVEKIFDPFFTTKRGKGGTGLGMNIVYNLVTGPLRGTIQCQSVLGRGTMFIIEFPWEDEPKHD